MVLKVSKLYVQRRSDEPPRPRRGFAGHRLPPVSHPQAINGAPRGLQSPRRKPSPVARGSGGEVRFGHSQRRTRRSRVSGVAGNQLLHTLFQGSPKFQGNVGKPQLVTNCQLTTKPQVPIHVPGLLVPFQTLFY